MSEQEIKNNAAGEERKEGKSTVRREKIDENSTAEKEEERAEEGSKPGQDEYGFHVMDVMEIDIEELMDGLGKMVSEGMIDDAIRLAEQWVEKNGEGERVFPSLTYELLEGQHLDEAEKLMERIKHDYPDDFNVMLLDTMLLLARGETERAFLKAEELVRERKKTSEKIERLHLLQSIFISSNAFEGAKRLTNMALKLKRSDSISLTNLGFIAVAQRELEVALKHFKRAIKVNPDEYAAWMGQGTVQEIMGETGKAVAHYRRMIERFPEEEEPYERLAHLEVIRRDSPGLSDVIMKAHENEILSPGLILALIQNSILDDNIEIAIMHLKDGLKIWPDDESLNAMLPVLLALKGRIMEARVFSTLYQAMFPGDNRILEIFRSLNDQLRDEGLENIGAFLSEKPEYSAPPEVFERMSEEMLSFMTAGELDYVVASVDIEKGMPDTEINRILDSSQAEFAKGVFLAMMTYGQKVKEAMGMKDKVLPGSDSHSNYYLLKPWVDISLEDKRIKPVVEVMDEGEKPEVINGKLRLYRGYFIAAGIEAAAASFFFPEFMEESSENEEI